MRRKWSRWWRTRPTQGERAVESVRRRPYLRKRRKRRRRQRKKIRKKKRKVMIKMGSWAADGTSRRTQKSRAARAKEATRIRVQSRVTRALLRTTPWCRRRSPPQARSRRHRRPPPRYLPPPPPARHPGNRTRRRVTRNGRKRSRRLF